MLRGYSASSSSCLLGSLEPSVDSSFKNLQVEKRIYGTLQIPLDLGFLALS